MGTRNPKPQPTYYRVQNTYSDMWGILVVETLHYGYPEPKPQFRIYKYIASLYGYVGSFREIKGQPVGIGC